MELMKRFCISEYRDEEGKTTTRITEYFEFDEQGNRTRYDEALFTLAEGETLEDWFTHASSNGDEVEQADAATAE